MAQTQTSQYICVGCITGPQGLKGQVKVKTFTEDPFDITSYGPLLDAEGQPLFSIKILRHAKGAMLVAAIEGVTDRTTAESLRNTELYVDCSHLPELEEDYYQKDLQGLQVVDQHQSPLGHVTAVHDFGAGIVLEIVPEGGGKTSMIPFRQEVCLKVDIASGAIEVDRKIFEGFQ